MSNKIETKILDAVTKLGVALDSFGDVLKLVAKEVQTVETSGITKLNPETDVIADAHKEKPVKKTRKKKTTKKQEETFEEIPETTLTVEVDADTLRKQFVAYAKAHSKQKAFDVLAKYEAKKVADLKVSDYPKVWNEIQITC